MRKLQSLMMTAAICGVFACERPSEMQQKYETHTATEGDFTYEYVSNDPLGARIYTLDNGLKVYLSVYKDAPRIQTYIAVKAGGKNDPSDATGLAHYLEHMMFKGTSKIGTQDFEQEKVLLDSIERMFEHYRTLEDPEERKAYYTKIDQVSNEASQFAIANEYDKLVSQMGAKGTNAYTTTDRTVYVNDIPSTELEKWLKVEGERFSMIVNRLFHTELEAVYEEKNRSLDNDQWKVYETLMSSLFPEHKYGTQTVIGTIDHLKNPSITEIKNYFNQYYKPNNVAICLSGDLNPEKTIELINKYFGSWQPNEDLEAYAFTPTEGLKAPAEKEVFGPSAAMVTMAYRFPGESSNSREFLKMKLCDMILSNSSAGLIDLNLKQKQEVLDASCYPYEMNDYSMHVLYGVPREGQELEEVKDLLLAQVEKLKKGEFEDWLLDAVVNDLKKSQIKKFERNSSRAGEFVIAFTNNIAWEDYVDDIDEMRTISKDELVRFANEYYKDNYVVVYKRTGEDPNAQKVEKPQISKVSLNRDKQSDYLMEIAAMESPKSNPMFLDYQKDIKETKMKSDVLVRYKNNEENDLFTAYYLLDVGSNTNPKLSLAVEYLEYLGTDKLSSEQVKKEFYKLGSNFGVNVAEDRVYVYLDGLDENMDKALVLFEDLLKNAKPDQDALDKLIANKVKERQDIQKDKGRILFQGMMNYGLYGANSPLTNTLSNEELQDLTAEELVMLMKELPTLEHRVLYYGPREMDEVVATLNQHRELPEKLKPLPEQKDFVKQDVDKTKVFWTNYDMVQAEILFLAKGNEYSAEREAASRLFNEYFGGGMGSIVFQEMREAQGLAYSVFSAYRTSSEKAKADYTLAYVGTQADKLNEAMREMKKLMDNLPEDEKAFNTAKASLLSKIESERITKSSVLFNYESALKKGLDHDIRKDVYNAVQNMTLEDVKAFHQNFIKDQNYVICVVGDKKKLDFNVLKAYGETRELTLEDLFAFEQKERVAQEQ
ncbi:insulinase family protein [Limibacter armeniacum]|uniref:M16 family metallopeptidase n=1 Tax=Limibacter armeniacum TaxID=466084 RepID=UPI002FE61F0A